MRERTSVLPVTACLIEDLRFLRSNSNTRLKGYSQRFLLDIREEMRGFTDELNRLINNQQSKQTGDLRPLIEDVREKRG
jgi:hypothetical protein